MTKNLITKIFAEEIKDSRGNPTLKVNVCVGDTCDSFSVPSGASTGIHEAHELRDEDKKGVSRATDKINNLLNAELKDLNILDQKKIDQKMIGLDGTPNKDILGGNSTIGISIACAKVGAKISKKETFEYLKSLVSIKNNQNVPYLYMNLINGGKHAQNNLAFQEYHIVPLVDNIEESVEIGNRIQNTLKDLILRELGENSIILGDEGGFAPKVSDVRKPLVFLSEAIKINNLEDKVRLALDVAASSFYNNGFYEVDNNKITKEELMNIYNSLIKEFNLISIEDPFEEEDFESFAKLKENNPNLIVIGDDLTVTSKKLLEKAIDHKSINGMIIKPNQIGTLTETLETMKLASKNNIKLVVSHRSGETNDNFIADLSYAFNCFGLKSGSPQKAERMVKYQRLIEITKIPVKKSFWEKFI